MPAATRMSATVLLLLGTPPSSGIKWLGGISWLGGIDWRL